MPGGRWRSVVVVALVGAGALGACSSGGSTTVAPSSLPAVTTTVATSATAQAASSPGTTAPPGRPAHFDTLPVGASLPSEEQCAEWVRPAPEVRSMNTPYNETRGFGSPADPPMPLFKRVTGNFTGTTDEILQWAACKWGIDEDIVRAQAAKESWWTQTNVGDNGESFGIMQDRQPFMAWAFNNGAGDARTSTAYNVDASLAVRRSCFEGDEPWLNTPDRGRDYAAGDIWGCVGMWFSGRWYTRPAVEYIAAVQDYLKNKVWVTSDFLKYSG
jgi:autotransporter family porin